MLLVLCFLIGAITGLRSMTAPAAVCWGAHLGWLHFAGTRFAFLDHPASLIVFTVFALGELVADKLPKTPARTAPPGLITRIVFGAACAVALAMSAGAALLVAGLIGVVGALVGTFGGYHIRRALVLRAHLPDFAVAVVEDLIAIGGGLLMVAHVSV